MKRIIFYTAGLVPTPEEQTALDKFEAAAVAPFDVIVGSAYAPAQSIPIRAGDYRYGATPAGYAALPVADPDAPPGAAQPPLPTTSAVVANGANVNVKNSAGTVTKVGVATVSASAVSGVALPATSAIVDNAGNVVVQNSAGAAVAGNHPATVAAGVVSNVKLAATVAPVTNGQAVTVGGATYTFTVANGVITNVVVS